MEDKRMNEIEEIEATEVTRLRTALMLVPCSPVSSEVSLLTL